MAQVRKNQRGFSLIEVMIATAIFAVFSVAFFSGIGHNLFTSMTFKDEIMIAELTESKLNELLISPPEFRESLTEAAQETKAFEDFPDFEYTVKMAKFFVPDMSKIQGQAEGEEQDPMQARIYEQIKKNMEEILWQLSVKVKHKPTGKTFELTSWLINEKAQVNVQGL